MAYDEKEKKITPDGTKLSGFVREGENQPPRECHNCIFYKHDFCHHPVIMIDPGVLGESGKPKPVNDRDCCNNFISQGRILMYALRHGETDLNSENKFRGWVDVSLDENGKNDAEEAGRYLKDKGISMIYCSDLKRSVQTAEIVAKILGIDKVYTDYRLRPWDVGALSGKERSKENIKILDDYIDNPDWQFPDGESLDEFSTRCQEALEFYTHEARNEGIKLLIFHTSNVVQLENYCNSEDPTGRPEGQDSVKPGGIIKVSEKNGKLYSKPVLKQNGPAEYGKS